MARVCHCAPMPQWHSAASWFNVLQPWPGSWEPEPKPEASAGAKRALKVFMRRVLHVKCNAGASASVGLGADAKKVAFAPARLIVVLSVAVAASAVVHGVCAIKCTSIDYNAAITPKRTSITARTAPTVSWGPELHIIRGMRSTRIKPAVNSTFATSPDCRTVPPTL